MTSEVLSSTRFDVYRAVTDRIVAAIEAGAGEFTLPWHRSGPATSRPVNAATGLTYRGVNVVGLWAEAHVAGFGSGHWASYRQWQGMGAQVRKGETGSLIVFFREIEREEEQDDENAQRRLVARSFRVFNADQVDGWATPAAFVPSEVEVLAEVERFVARTGASVTHGGNAAYYDLKHDRIVLPERERFLGSSTRSPSEAYYATLLHELTHWTGAACRLARQFGRRFGDHDYAVEELIADLGAAFLCADLHVTNEPRPDHAAYLATWLDLLKQDARLIFTAARLANRATDYLHEVVAEAGAS